MKERAAKRDIPIVEAPKGRRDVVDPYFARPKPDQVVVILKAREPARIMIAIGGKDRWHLQIADRWVLQYNFYINDRIWGRMFVRICRAKGLIARLPHSHRYRLLPQGCSISVIFLKLFERIYAPLTAGLLSPISADARLQNDKRSQLDRLYQRVVDDLDALVRTLGLNLKAA